MNDYTFIHEVDQMSPIYFNCKPNQHIFAVAVAIFASVNFFREKSHCSAYLLAVSIVNFLRRVLCLVLCDT